MIKCLTRTKISAIMSLTSKRERRKHGTLKISELSSYIATLLISELPEKNRNVYECERILKESLDIIKGVTLDNSILRR